MATQAGDRGGSATYLGSSYPIDFQADYPENPSKLYTIPIVGWLIRVVLLIPHAIAVTVLSWAVAFIQLFAWAPVLFTGKFQPGLYSFEAGVLRWSGRMYAYLFGLTDQYPPFALGSDDDGYSVRVLFERPEESSRLWAIPLVGYVIKLVILIPHFIAVSVLGLVTVLMQLVSWIPVLFSGKYPSWAYSFTTGYLRWSMRTSGFFLGLTDQYPPFRLGARLSDDGTIVR